ncbi:MAG: ring-cleaving dioxygenase [Bryobacteraceae bacterium]|nr:ring-cleaving dioxygenase [Bryobacteraceae bacterium]
MIEQPQTPRIDGIHHVTAIASAPQPNLDFYVRFLGLRLVKRTVNFDDPGTYHFYYGDDTGAPGTILTFFPSPGARRGRLGSGQVTATTFTVPFDSIDYWSQRATSYGFTALAQPDRFGHSVLRVDDGDGLVIELVAAVSAESTPCTRDGVEIPAEYAVRNIHSATLTEKQEGPTAQLLTATMGFRETAREGNRIRFEVGDGGPTRTIDVLVADPSTPGGLGGAGTVHHIAFRTPDDAHQQRWQELLMKEGHHVSPVMDRNYFHSIYYREPGHILFEIATDPPGFQVDETPETLGSALKLPQEYESMRGRIEAALPAITVPTAGALAESY